MALTKSFRETVQQRAAEDPAYREGLYREAIQCILDGDPATGRALLRNLINATIGFVPLAAHLGMSDKSLMRMLGPAGNPQLDNLAAIITALREECSLSLRVEAKQARRHERRAAVAAHC